MPCDHLRDLEAVQPTSTEGCVECLAGGTRWVHLRLCMACGHVGCCDSSPERHATGHHVKSGHAVVQSFEPGERWAFCYTDQDVLADVGDDLDVSYG